MSLFWQQFKALLKRNFLLKIRIKKTTFQEFFFPLYFVAMLALVMVFTSPKVKPAIPSFPRYTLDDAEFYLPVGVIVVSPDVAGIRQLMNDVVDQFPDHARPTYKVYNDWKLAEQAYVQSTSNSSVNVIAGLNFTHDLHTSQDYTLRLPHGAVPYALNVFGWDGNCRSLDGRGRVGCPVNRYLFSGFAQLQLAVDVALTKLQTGSVNTHRPQLSIQMMGKAEMDPDIHTMQILASIYFVMAFAPFVGSLTGFLVAKKKKVPTATLR